jgi:sugar/nucleoside kinase (ribokinase family)
VPAYSTEVVDPTGAGDAYLAGFFAEYADRQDLRWCSSVGSAAASAVVETVGPSIRITKDELIERAERVHNGIRTLG